MSQVTFLKKANSTQKICTSRVDGQTVQIPADIIKWRIGAYAVVVDTQTRLLVLENRWTGKYDLLGGGMHDWESATDCLVREVREETSLLVEPKCLAGTESQFLESPTGKYWHRLQLFFTVQVLGGSLQSSIAEDESSVNPHWIDTFGL